MKKILLGLFFSLIAFQVNAAPVALIDGEITGNGFEIYTDEPFSGGATTLTLGAGFTYDLNLAANDNPLGTIAGYSVTFNGIEVVPGNAIIGLSAGIYNIVFSGTATAPNTTATLQINATGTAIPVSSVPVPAAVWLFGSALLGMVGVSRRKSA